MKKKSKILDFNKKNLVFFCPHCHNVNELSKLQEDELMYQLQHDQYKKGIPLECYNCRLIGIALQSTFFKS